MRRFAYLALVLLVGSSCAQSPAYDELAGETSADDQVDGGKVDSAVAGAYTYYSIVQQPAAGGYALARLNRSTTTCADGSTQAVCPITNLDWSESGLTAPTQQKLLDASGTASGTGGVFAIARGRFAKKTVDHVATSRFVVTEAWVAEGPTVADGVYVRITDSQIRCITAPCPTLTERALNTSRAANISDLDFGDASLTDREVAGFMADTTSPSGFLIAGDRYTATENGHPAKGRTATAAFHRLVEPAVPLAPCVPAGCSRQECSDNPALLTTCIWKPEYVCYRDATCERQDDGACGWTETPALDACIADAR